MKIESKESLESRLRKAENLIGNTPMYTVECNGVELNLKLENLNFTGSVKSRPAYHILKEAVRSGDINESTTVVESSSGNFALAVASLCRLMGIRFVAIIDPNINRNTERLLRLLCYDVVKVTERDETGGYLLTRIATVKRILSENENSYWTRQYDNPFNYLSYCRSLGPEIGKALDHADYAFVAVSSCGTIKGLSLSLPEFFPNIKIVAVDVEGSAIFGGEPQKRYLTGIGASFSSPHLEGAKIDHVVIVSQMEAVQGSRDLLDRHSIFAGSSAGAVYAAVEMFFSEPREPLRPRVVAIVPDQGDAYLDTVYNDDWVAETIGLLPV